MQKQKHMVGGMSHARFYEEWMEKEGIPIYEAVAGVEDIKELPRRPWARHGGLGTFIKLQGTTEAGMLLWVVEIPAGGALEPEKHLYDELIYILRGRGLTEVWQVGGSKRTFEWGEGSLFAVPTNAWHRLVNGSRQPVLYVAKSNAAVVMNAHRNIEFVYNCDYNFTDRYSEQADYFQASEKYVKEGLSTRWETNFIPDVRTCFLESGRDRKVLGGQGMQFRMAAWPVSHTSLWPVGIYHKAHWHGPGAVLLGLKSVGFGLIWPRRYGLHPFQDGYGDKVIKMGWKPGSIYSPFSESFHQHFNTGPEPAQLLALRGGGHGFDVPRSEVEDESSVSVRDGGQMIEHDDEDPEIRRMFQEALRKNGVKFTMAPVVYRTDPFDPFKGY